MHSFLNHYNVHCYFFAFKAYCLTVKSILLFYKKWYICPSPGLYPYALCGPVDSLLCARDVGVSVGVQAGGPTCCAGVSAARCRSVQVRYSHPALNRQSERWALLSLTPELNRTIYYFSHSHFYWPEWRSFFRVEWQDCWCYSFSVTLPTQQKCFYFQVCRANNSNTTRRRDCKVRLQNSPILVFIWVAWMEWHKLFLFSVEKKQVILLYHSLFVSASLDPLGQKTYCFEEQD